MRLLWFIYSSSTSYYCLYILSYATILAISTSLGELNEPSANSVISNIILWRLFDERREDS